MKYWDSLALFFIALTYNVTIIGKIWLTLVILPRLMVILFAGYPLYQDEHHIVICNTMQPGCSHSCYDYLAPMSHLQFSFIQTVFVLLPYVVFSIYVWHNVVRQVVKAHSSPYQQYKEIQAAADHQTTKNTARSMSVCGANEMDIPNFSRAYIVHLFLRILMEAGFVIGHYCLFGFYVPKHFSCFQKPCPYSVDCFVSRSTEKSVMMVYIWGLSVFSVVLCLVDLVFAFRTKTVRYRRSELVLERWETDEKCTSSLHQGD